MKPKITFAFLSIKIQVQVYPLQALQHDKVPQNKCCKKLVLAFLHDHLELFFRLLAKKSCSRSQIVNERGHF